ncbi:hypothetical protein ACPRNU_05910 [Chromobacterium vaccinii]|uniref:hypothetical protein n=1 Tax=Chromobacterium vaccinii TaxID=1108595 RepID=UPI003C72C630
MKKAAGGGLRWYADGVSSPDGAWPGSPPLFASNDVRRLPSAVLAADESRDSSEAGGVLMGDLSGVLRVEKSVDF